MLPQVTPENCNRCDARPGAGAPGNSFKALERKGGESTKSLHLSHHALWPAGSSSKHVFSHRTCWEMYFAG